MPGRSQKLGQDGYKRSWKNRKRSQTAQGQRGQGGETMNEEVQPKPEIGGKKTQPTPRCVNVRLLGAEGCRKGP